MQDSTLQKYSGGYLRPGIEELPPGADAGRGACSPAAPSCGFWYCCVDLSGLLTAPPETQTACQDCVLHWHLWKEQSWCSGCTQVVGRPVLSFFWHTTPDKTKIAFQSNLLRKLWLPVENHSALGKGWNSRVPWQRGYLLRLFRRK